MQINTHQASTKWQEYSSEQNQIQLLPHHQRCEVKVVSSFDQPEMPPFLAKSVSPVLGLITEKRRSLPHFT